MGVFSSSTTGVDVPAGQATMPRGGSSGSHKSRRTESACRGPGSIPASELSDGLEFMAVNGVDGNEGGSMMFDTSGPENCTTIAAKEVLSLAPEASTFNWQLSNQPCFAGFAMSVLNSGGESAVIGDNNRHSLLSLVKYLEESARATSLERTSFLEAHQAEFFHMRVECEKRVAEVQLTTEMKMKEVNTRLETASKERSEALLRLTDVESSLAASTTELQECEKRAHNVQLEVKEWTVQIEKSYTKAAELEKKLRLSQNENEMGIQRHKTAIALKERVIEDLNSDRDRLMATCSKFEAQIAQIEQRAATDSLSSGSYAEDRANPSMLQDIACQSVDKATDALSKILHDKSITKRRDSEEKLELFVRRICPAKLGDFSRPLHVKYVWSHRICFVMFRGFEHCYFDIDGGQLTSPLDAKRHAIESFECFQLSKAMPSSEFFKSCDRFRAFCEVKYAELFPQDLLKSALISSYTDEKNSIHDRGRFSGDATIFNCFLDVAKAVWLLHKLSFAFDPPVSVLRMAYGETFDKQFHEAVVIDEDRGGGSSKVVLMIRPALRVRNTIIRSRVFRANV